MASIIKASNHLRCSLKEPGSRRAKSDATHILAQAGTNKRNRIYEATDITDLYHDIATINPSGWQTPRPRRRWNRQLDHTPAPT